MEAAYMNEGTSTEKVRKKRIFNPFKKKNIDQSLAVFLAVFLRLFPPPLFVFFFYIKNFVSYLNVLKKIIIYIHFCCPQKKKRTFLFVATIHV